MLAKTTAFSQSEAPSQAQTNKSHVCQHHRDTQHPAEPNKNHDQGAGYATFTTANLKGLFLKNVLFLSGKYCRIVTGLAANKLIRYD